MFAHDHPERCGVRSTFASEYRPLQVARVNEPGPNTYNKNVFDVANTPIRHVKVDRADTTEKDSSPNECFSLMAKHRSD